MKKNEISAVIPVYNDKKSLESAIPVSLATLEKITDSFEIIIAEDNSSDGSRELVEEWGKKDPRVKLLHSDERQGRGNALNKAFTYAGGDIVCYYDVDLATDMNHLKKLIESIKEGADISTGSRLLPDSDIVRTKNREIASRGYNKLVRIILKSKIHDHQCGFKAFRKESLMNLIPSVSAGHWFWDTEILIRGQRAGYKIYEFPVHWKTGEGTTVRFSDIFSMGSDILKLWWQLR
ncbi:glycosyltransferase involved in cell wall biosynthesis [Methanomicrobium sp. W14]|jgi:glycosyltransferase involved in cell wall biosynthesis|uniref:dolichyl-phosphate beta-glucosyltransferase n=1 Tax=Methanomicrobium sp. W14 TaxID=2817839 RepID=UPI001AEB70C6|nr:dolichyl-phosphate beta-glucosyltransferase [Methanomicrobium sp. W14]MBP2133016.1 glycosyltransferase involved in cell wall biosynthesis [Methanomicrobium sp. W14]